ncbi:ATP-dependent helicase HrpB [Sodalis ligni]|uniref:ATP-dependent helicase HrpB n=1 Tax=Sodalis ligni TaxID=2697027 RepID=A0A4R1NPC5_9GAMM|nr:ATP-dependent helicase HrpB [Sodalis ligni]TCL06566.1 ATP-dependent helicase HrpB [Sodalis ligni]
MLTLSGDDVTSLPVSAVVDELLAALRDAGQVLLHAPTGAGKSTWLPLELLRRGGLPGRIVMLEPRRLATKNIALRLASQLGESVGATVGYRMRAESRIGGGTRLEVVTEGILTRMLQQDPELPGVSLVILDEFHERSLQADLALALLLDVQQGLRGDLRLLIMSATLDDERLLSLLPGAPVIRSVGRSFPVERSYHPLPSQGWPEPAIAADVNRMLRLHSGSLLLFLPGVAEIRRVRDLLAERVAEDVDLCPLYGALSLDEQQRAIRPAEEGRRKVVLATNIAETSLTIEGIRLVADSGLERVADFDARSGLSRLQTQRISQASMAQRAGRAGRLAPGICWHLFSQPQAERAPEYGQPEILHSDLCGMYLELLLWGCRDASELRWLDSPPEPMMAAARDTLRQLGAIDDAGRLTTVGRAMGRLGCDPRLAAMLCHGEGHDDGLATAALLAAIIEEPPRSGSPDLRDYLARPQSHWLRRAKQLAGRLSPRWGTPDGGRAEALLAWGFRDRIARRRDLSGRYLLANGLGAALPPDEALSAAEWLIAPGLLQVSRNPDATIRLAMPLDIAMLIARFPQWVTVETAMRWDREKGSLRVVRREQIGSLVLLEQPQARPSAELMQQALLNWVAEQGLSVLNWDEPAQQLRQRLLCAREWLPETDWPAVDDAALLAELPRWLQPSLTGVHDVRALQQVNLGEALMRLLDWPQRQRLESALPSHYTVPTGSRLPVRYRHGEPPVLAVRMQEIFGEQSTPLLAEGRVGLVLELLSPARHPLQKTGDLAAFWRGAYRDVQKEMKGRYPKHVWPDDPGRAAPTRRTKKYQ